MPAGSALDFDLNLLGHLAALLDTGSVTRAAQRLGISQPAMSRSLAELRRVFCDPLLVRTRGGMLPTRRAQELAEPLRQWLAGAQSIMAPSDFHPARLNRRFRITATEYGAKSVIAPALAAIGSTAPGMIVEVLQPAGDLVAALTAGDADLAITSADPDRRMVHDRLLSSEPYMCVVRAGHPLAARSRTGALSSAQLLGFRQVSVDGGASNPRPIVSFPYVAPAAALVASTDALMLAPRGMAEECAAVANVALLPAPPDAGTFRQWLLWHNRAHRDPALQWLAHQLAAAGRPAVLPEAAE